MEYRKKQKGTERKYRKIDVRSEREVERGELMRGREQWSQLRDKVGEMWRRRGSIR